MIFKTVDEMAFHRPTYLSLLLGSNFYFEYLHCKYTSTTKIARNYYHLTLLSDSDSAAVATLSFEILCIFLALYSR